MRLSVVKIFLSAFFLALTVVKTTGYACDYNEFLLDEQEIYLVHFENDAAIGSSCFVDLTDSFLAVTLPTDTCQEESDGAWGTDAPEGIFSQDHPDAQPTSALFSLSLPTVVYSTTFDMTSARIPSIHPGVNNPPPQL